MFATHYTTYIVYAVLYKLDSCTTSKYFILHIKASRATLSFS